MPLSDPYRIDDPSALESPCVVIFRERLEANIDTMLRVAGSAGRLRPHCKSHKITEIAAMLVERGITRHKAATFAEAEMLVAAGATDVLLAYPLVGPNINRAIHFLDSHPDVRFSVLADHPAPIAELSDAAQRAGTLLDVWLDIDTGQARTGICPEKAAECYRQLVDADGLVPAGLHVYDGQNHQSDVGERRAATHDVWRRVTTLRETLQSTGCDVPKIVLGGSGTFPLYAELDEPAVELSPGTVIFFDAGYSKLFPDLTFQPAALLLTRVISRPTPRRITLDLGYKACAADPPADRRIVLPEIPDAKAVLHNEEHLVIESAHAEEYQPGDVLLAVPWHVCPTTALHKEVYVIREGRIECAWPVVARDRKLSV